MALVVKGWEEHYDLMIKVGGQEEQLSVVLGPEDWQDNVESLRWARTQGLWQGDGGLGELEGAALANYQLILRVKAWEGVEDGEGQPLPCSLVNRLRFFGAYPLALSALWEEMDRRREEEEKNSGASQPG